MSEPVAEWIDHECEFPEVLVEEGDGALATGMHVLTPCEKCGATPLEHMEWLQMQTEELGKAITQQTPGMPLYHWAPASRRKQIVRYGLRPWMRYTTSSISSPVVCLADTPSWAWALSGEQRHAPAGDWDLWQTLLDRIESPVVMPSTDRSSAIHEIRTEHRIYKRDLWLVGSRTKP